MGVTRPRSRVIVAGLALGLLAAIAPGAAQAQAPRTVGIRILDAPTNRSADPRARLYIVDHLSPGTTIKRRVEISNDTERAQPVQLYAASGEISGGTFRFGDGRAANELTTWTTVDPPTLNLPVGAKTPATVTIAVPPNASPGERYGVVWVELAAAAPPGGGVAAVNRVGVRIYLSVGPGGEPASDFGITTLEAKRDGDGNPTVSATVQNTGGRALDLGGELRLTNGPGGLSAGPFDAKLGTTLGIGQSEPVLVVLDRALPAGPWDARIVLRSGTTEKEATAKVTFPDAPATAAGPVEAESDSGGSSLLPLALGAAAVIAVIGLAAVFLRGRKSSPV